MDQTRQRTARDLPEICYAFDGPTSVVVYRGGGVQPSFMPLPQSAIDALNAVHGVTRQQVAAMLAGAANGWEAPAANPDNYDENGNLVGEHQIEEWG
jgi:hypothetical protein